MIRKILIGAIVLLLAIMTYFTIANGVKIGNIEAYGVSKLKEENSKIDVRIQEASKLTSTDYPGKTSELNKNIKSLLSKKEEYKDLTTYSTPDQVTAANELDDFEVEYLWVLIGNYATKQGIKLKMDISPAVNGTQTSDGRKMYDLNFTVEGSYIGIALFMSDLQNDSFLEFKLENFTMKGSETLTSTFIVKDVPIKIDNISSGNNTNTQDNKSNNNNNNNSTNSTTTNTTNNNNNNNTNSTTNTTSKNNNSTTNDISGNTTKNKTN